MAYTRISHTGVHKGRVQVIVAMYLEPTDPNYNKQQVYLPVFPPGGYPGAVDDKGMPINQTDYDTWVASLPHIWQNNPFHNHCIYGSPDSVDSDFKQQIQDALNYFYTFHQQAWSKGIPFIEDWKKVPVKIGTIRYPFVKGDLSELNKGTCLVKAQDILARKAVFDTGGEILPPPLGIGEKGTIIIGAAAIDRSNNTSTYTMLNIENPANDTGTIDTIEIWAAANIAGDELVGTFYLVSGTTYHCRDVANLGAVTAGSKQTFTGLSIDVVTDDLLGAYTPDTSIEYSSSGYDGLYYISGNTCVVDNESVYSLVGDDAISLYGTGTTGAPPAAGSCASVVNLLSRRRR